MDDGMRSDPLGGSGGLAGFPTEPAQGKGGGEHTIIDLLNEMINRKASDLHLTVGSPPCIRVDGEIVQLGYPRYLPPDVKGLVYSLMREDQIKNFEIEHEFDFAYGIKTLGRFRVNVFQQRGSV